MTRTQVTQNGVAIRCLREKDGWTQNGLAEHLGIDQGTLSNIEREEKGISPDLLNRIARSLSVPTAAIERNPETPPRSARRARPVPALPEPVAS